MAEENEATSEASTPDPFGPKRGLSDIVAGTEPGDPNDGRTCEVADCDQATVNTALCEDHVPPRVRPGRMCRSCGSITTETWAVGPPGGGEYPVCSTACLLRLSRRWHE